MTSRAYFCCICGTTAPQVLNPAVVVLRFDVGERAAITGVCGDESHAVEAARQGFEVFGVMPTMMAVTDALDTFHAAGGPYATVGNARTAAEAKQWVQP